MKHIIHRMRHRAKNNKMAALLAVSFLFISVMTINAKTPTYEAELNFAETSSVEGALGGMLPASCESGGNNLVGPGHTSTCVWGNQYCTGPSDPNGNNWQIWEISNDNTTDYRYAGLSCFPSRPTNLQATCDPSGTQVSLTWSAGLNSTKYYPRVGAVSGQSCPAGWTASNATDCYIDNILSERISYPTVPGKAYTAWIYGGNDLGVNWAMTANVAFTCNAPPTVNLNFSLIDSVRIFIKDFFANIAENPITKVSAEVINKY